MNVIISLPLHNYSLSFNRDYLIESFPGSILADAAELVTQPDEVIPLTSPLVTPSLLLFLHDYIEQQEIPARIPTDTDLMAASAYLNIPLLALLTDPWFPTYRLLQPDINSMWFTVITEDVYENMLNMAVFGKATHIVWYLMQVISREAWPSLVEIEATAFVNAALIGAADIVRIMLARVNPVTARGGQNYPFAGAVV